jgi:CubicO group peptidase (beta-lactamase class C family)
MEAEMAERQAFAWDTVPPEHCRMDRARLDALRDTLAARGTQSLLVVRRDRVAYEWYAPGYGPARRHYTASLAKALVGGTSLLLALNDGRIAIDDPASKYIPAWRDHPLKRKITVRHLATHSSGIEDAELSREDRARALAEGKTLTDHHMSLPGWKGVFWRRQVPQELDPFTAAIHQAPVIFEPGTRYAYSNPGMAALAYTVTASLRGTPQADRQHPTDIRTLLKERILDPIGVPEDAWSIGYGRAYEVDGMQMYANWGGGEFTARAVARIGRLMLHKGEWGGRQLVDAGWVDKMLAYAQTPLPDRPPGNPQPASGLCWWTNYDGVWPSLPRDAFAGAGAGNQILLVVPCRDLIVVRNGDLLGDPSAGEGFWGGVVKFLFEPLMDAFCDRLPGDVARAPYPPSMAIREATFAPVSTTMRRAFHSDNWPITWADDGHLYTAYGDGRGFEPYTDELLSLGLACVAGMPGHMAGTPDALEGTNIRTESGERSGFGPEGAKASGMLSVGGILYMWVRNVNNSQLAWSTDHGQTWTWCDWRFTTGLGCPTFLNYGQDYAGARDEYVYVFSSDSDSAYVPADQMVLARVHQEHIPERDAYEFFVRLDPGENPVWTDDIRQRGAVFVHPGHCLRSGISYNAPLGRYLWWQQLPRGLRSDTRFQAGFGLFDAPEPWGPWTTVYFTLEWDTGPGDTGGFPTKWMSEDGMTCSLVFSGNDYFSVRQMSLTADSEGA